MIDSLTPEQFFALFLLVGAYASATLYQRHATYLQREKAMSALSDLTASVTALGASVTAAASALATGPSDGPALVQLKSTVDGLKSTLDAAVAAAAVPVPATPAA